MTTAKDIMTTTVITVTTETPVREIASLLLEKRISGVVVTGAGGEALGVVTESDLIDQAKRLHIPSVLTILDAVVYLENPHRLEQDIKKMAGVTAGDIASRKLVSVAPNTSLEEIATLMAEKKIHTLPVLADGQLVGVIGKADIIRTIAGATTG